MNTAARPGQRDWRAGPGEDSDLPLVDASAFLAVAFEEDGHELFKDVISAGYAVAAVSLVELRLRLRSLWGGDGAHQAEAYQSLLASRAVEIAAFGDADAITAGAIFDRFGKGRAAPPAVLNFGDCLVYAIAKRTGRPLLFKGDDFQHTDLIFHEACQDGKGRLLTKESSR